MLFTRRSGGEREHIEAKRPESSRECAAGIRGDMQQKLGDRMAGTAGSKPRTSAAAVSGQCVCGRVRLEIGYPAFWAWHDHSQITRQPPEAKVRNSKRKLGSKNPAFPVRLVTFHPLPAKRSQIDRAVAA